MVVYSSESNFSSKFEKVLEKKSFYRVYLYSSDRVLFRSTLPTPSQVQQNERLPFPSITYLVLQLQGVH